jgi:hypothetical protein
MEQKERAKAELDYGTMTNSQHFDNPECKGRQASRAGKLNYNLEDSLSR